MKDNKLPDNFGEYLHQQMTYRRDRKKELLSSGWSDRNKYDNLNGGRPRQEYLEELDKARQDAYNHTVTFSDGFNEWMADRYQNQHRERMEDVRQIEDHMFVKKEPHPMDIAIREQMAGKEKLVQARRRIAEHLFPDDLTERLHDNVQSRDPMDIAMRKRLADQQAKRKA